MPCPVCSREGTFYDVLTDHLNDRHMWTREQIADWLDTLFVQPFALVLESRPWLVQEKPS